MYSYVDKIKLVLPQAVIFDFDSTLCDSWPLLVKTWQSFMSKQGVKAMSEKEILSLPHVPQAQLIEKIFGTPCEHLIAQYWQIYDEVHQESPPLINGAQDLIRFLYHRNIYLGIATNSNGERVRLHCRKHKIDKYFSKIIGIGDTIYFKPNAEIIYQVYPSARKQVRAFKKSIDYTVWYVGDSPNDILTAKNAGILPVWIKEKATQQIESILNGADVKCYPLLQVNTLTSLLWDIRSIDDTPS